MPTSDLAQQVLAVAYAHGQATNAWGASVAVSRNGQLAAEVDGWCDADRERPVRIDTLFRIASVTKPITAAIIRSLVREQRLSLEDRAFGVLELKPEPNVGDPRLNDITVEQLLKHQGGWDRATAYDPMFHQAEIQKELQLDRQPGLHDIIHYMLRQPLQFQPGEKAAYSNFGYCVLGRIIERVTVMPYADAVQKFIGIPLKIADDLKLGQQKVRLPRETDYSGNQQSFDLDVMDAHGGLVATPTAICRFLEAYWITGELRTAEEQQEWTHYGSLPGTAAMAWQRSDGWNIAVLLNGRKDDNYRADLDTLKAQVGAAVEAKS